MARVDRNHERLRRNRWLKALQLAKLLFEDEGYFTDYLEQVEDFVKNNHAKINDAVVEFSIRIKKSFVLTIDILKIAIIIEDLRMTISLSSPFILTQDASAILRILASTSP